MNEQTYFTFDIDTKLYNFAFIMNVKGKNQKEKYIERDRRIMIWNEMKGHTPETHKHHRLKSYIKGSIVLRNT
jgi:hypothetical protein